jgi:hypothetical protein
MAAPKHSSIKMSSMTIIFFSTLHKAFIERTGADPYMEMVYRDDECVIFRVTR